jgi:hemoglobin-like flavoprotein
MTVEDDLILESAARAEILERSLWAVAEADRDITPIFFSRLFARYPEQRPSFHHADSTCGAMVNEMIETVVGLATGEDWVERSTQSLVMAHRCYGDIPLALYADSIDMLIDTLAEVAGDDWSEQFETVWREQGSALKTLIARVH